MIAFESIATTAFSGVSGNSNLNIAKPSGLAVGDLLLVHLTILKHDSGGGSWQTPSGWTALTNGSKHGNLNSTVRLTTYCKFASSGDVAASSFDFQKDGTSAVACGGALYRFSGVASVAANSNDTQDTLTPTFADTITPSFPNSMLLFLTSMADQQITDVNGTPTTSGYSIVTDNPTWTERCDFDGEIYDGAFNSGLMAGATGPRSQTTATGNSTCTYSHGSATGQNSIGVMIVLTPFVNVTVTPSVLADSINLIPPVVTGDANLTETVLSATFSLIAPVVTSPVPLWTNRTKNTSTWVHKPKS